LDKGVEFNYTTDVANMRTIVYFFIVAFVIIYYAMTARMFGGQLFTTSKFLSTGLLINYNVVMVFSRSLVRLYVFPNKLFDPFTSFADDDSIQFRRYSSIVLLGSALIGYCIWLL
jgi:hypothetical protein